MALRPNLAVLAAFHHLDVDAIRHDRRRVRNVILVAEQKLQCVVARSERNLRLRLPRAEMQVVEVVRDRLVERRHRRIDQEKMMTGIRPIGASAARPYCGGRNKSRSSSELSRRPSDRQSKRRRQAVTALGRPSPAPAHAQRQSKQQPCNHTTRANSGGHYFRRHAEPSRSDHEGKLAELARLGKRGSAGSVAGRRRRRRDKGLNPLWLLRLHPKLGTGGEERAG